MPITIITSRQAADLQGVKTLVHSRAGMGKTTLCATAPAPFIISAEAGMLSLRGHDIPTVVISTMAEMFEVYAFLNGSTEARQYQTICLDSISEIAEVVLNAEKLKNKDPRKAYGEMQDQMASLIRAFRDLRGRNVYFSAKQKATKDEVTSVTLYGPSMPGQNLSQQLPYFFDEVFSLEVYRDHTTQQEWRYLRTKPNFQFEAKDRSGALDEMEQPNLTHIFNKIMGVQHG